MTPKEKAEELVGWYFDLTYHMSYEEAKQCAIKAVDEILSKRLAPHLGWKEVDFWKEVKQEIEKL